MSTFTTMLVVDKNSLSSQDDKADVAPIVAKPIKAATATLFTFEAFP